MKPIHLILLIVLLAACKGKPAKIAKNPGVYYTCSMHTQVMEPVPGNCPICGMKLIAVKQSRSIDKDEINLSDQQAQLGNISVDTIRDGMSGGQSVLTATINFDQAKVTTISSRIMGRIEKLYFKTEGAYVHKGDRLYDLYSEDLNNAKKEYLLAIKNKPLLDNSVIDFDQLISSAKNKLLLWGLSESEIKQLVSTKDAGTKTAFYSAASGYINALDVKEGYYVMEGGAIVHLADLSTVWAEAQVYSSELSKIEKNVVAQVRIPDLGQKAFMGKVEFVNSELNSGTQINLVRVEIPNNDHLLKPGMAAYVIIKNQSHAMLSMPVNAVLRDGKAATVWLKTGAHTYKSAMVQVGMETGDKIEITSGLKGRDLVVITGTYLLNSEYIFKNGANPMSGMKM
ncbi:Cu(I)/Ag(I) efflux system membrane fusion protein [Mucilaginibacter sp. UYP25]|uniref:efflux RND transporter periplasmic adaptor subunit n=1 Tax=unclassified Mucilaginibacter TaxID=2617802 RepID=UPI003398B8EF